MMLNESNDGRLLYGIWRGGDAGGNTSGWRGMATGDWPQLGLGRREEALERRDSDMGLGVFFEVEVDGGATATDFEFEPDLFIAIVLFLDFDELAEEEGTRVGFSVRATEAVPITNGVSGRADNSTSPRLRLLFLPEWRKDSRVLRLSLALSGCLSNERRLVDARIPLGEIVEEWV